MVLFPILLCLTAPIDSAQVADIFARARDHYLAIDATTHNDQGKFPHGWKRDKNKYDMRSIYWWTSGHFAGSLWYLYDATHDERLKTAAEYWTAQVAPNAKVDDNHDIGFIMNCARSKPELILETARSLCRRFNPDLGLIRSWGDKDSKKDFIVIPDNLMNLELLEVAANLPGGEKRFDEVARAHADTTMQHHFRADGGCRHVLHYDQATKRVKSIDRGQGASAETAWSRGQSWGIYGYTMMYRFTKELRYLNFAQKLADYAINHPNMPSDGIPYWDYGAPGEERDSSAAAVMASALLELCGYVDDEKGKKYRDFAIKQLTTLASSEYFSQGDEIGHFLLKHGVGSKPEHSEIDTPLVYGDYYFLEALTRLNNCKVLNNGELGIGNSTRESWVRFAEKLARPVLAPMAEGRLHEVYNFEKGTLEISPTWNGRSKEVAYMEIFARLMSGLAPWLALPDDDTGEGKLRAELRALALKAYANAVDPNSPDYLGWNKGGQALVDAAFLAESFLRAWDALWVPLDDTTKSRYIAEFEGLRRYSPPYQNWVLFCSLEECFILKAGGKVDEYRLRTGLYKVEEWYVGDGWYSDGPSFAFDYYNSYVIHPMYYECVKTLVEQKRWCIPYLNDQQRGRRLNAQERLGDIEVRMQKYGVILERMISPEGAYPVFGRSIPYRMGAFQALALLALEKKLPAELHPAQVRCALEAVRARMFKDESNFNKAGFLTLGFVGSYPEVGDSYTNNGSLYMTSLFLLPLGLPAGDPFWTLPDEPWTQKKAWGGEPFSKDHKWNINPKPLYWE